jgi:hypothetical protein
MRCTPCEVHTHEVHACEMHAHEMNVYEVHIHEMCACEVHVQNLYEIYDRGKKRASAEELFDVLTRLRSS